jgi:hypothetical protein
LCPARPPLAKAWDAESLVEKVAKAKIKAGTAAIVNLRNIVESSPFEVCLLKPFWVGL